ncbi:hypothetical protein HU200_026435 [Digitaria exilis]|uniref:Phytocyanin domain-containing protein n=1 Tax=Digitaria exilis TaxID=1010633 RepID=A0A835BY77_9POAL|nr:hypothetical protein HU200_026435 [Digitaria exilis]CAB3464410.1 unnamed protein product [Digitaria exilis]
MARRSQHALLLLSAVLASLVAGSTAGVYHIVGAGKGWRMPPNRTYYDDWARSRQISIGDKLMFLYRSGVHNIVEVPTRALFDVCSMRNITSRYQNGPTIIELGEAGPRYYFCGVGEHCEVGQKLAINVLLVAPPQLDTTNAGAAAPACLFRHAAGLAAACSLVSVLLLLMVV